MLVLSRLQPQLLSHDYSGIIVLIIKGDRGNEQIGYNYLVESENLYWTINGNLNNSNLVSHCHGKFSVNYHGHQFWAIG